MGEYTKTLDLAAEEALTESIKNSTELCNQIQKDQDNRNNLDHDKIESLQYCWTGMHNIFDSAAPESNSAAENENTYMTITGKVTLPPPKKPSPKDYITAKVM